MAHTNGSNGKSSADLEQEVTDQRNRVEARIGEIRDRLSPGQLLDEALSYTKDGGMHFATNLGRQVSANPLPAVLTGVGIAWLIASNARGVQPEAATQTSWHADDDTPYARIGTGGLQRTRHAADEAGQWWSEFQSDAGETFRAKADEMGQRAGHFTDNAGKRFAGFIDDAGNRVRDFRDESGNRLHEGLGWASHSWSEAQRGVSQAVRNAADGATQLGSQVRGQADQMSRQVNDLFRQQPMIAGALAFAVGAALGVALPHTQQEDALVGKEAERVRRKAADTANDLYEQGKQQASQVYEEARKTGEQVYRDAKETVAGDGANIVRH